MKVVLIVSLILGACQAQHLQTQEVYQGPPGYYFFDAYVGSQLQQRRLLIDTQANGTAVDYDYTKSMTAERPNTRFRGAQKYMKGKVAMPSSKDGGYVDGTIIFDEISFDLDEEVYVDDFMFLLSDFIEYKELESYIANKEFNGVIGFNRFGFEKRQGLGQTLGIKGKSNVVKAMIQDFQLINQIIQLDLNPVLDWNGVAQKSYISYDGLKTDNILNGNKDPQIHFFDNRLKDSKWVLNIEDAKLNNQQFYSKCAKSDFCPAIIATASPTLKVPFADFTEIAKILTTEEPAVKIDRQQIKSRSSCNSLKLPPIRLSFSADLDLAIPPFLYTRNIDVDGYKCLLLIEENLEDNKREDAIITEEDGLDYTTNNGYILGAPALQSFMILFDFKNNKIGMAQKANSFGASFLDRSSGGPPKPPPPIHIDDKPHDDTKKDDNKDSQDDNTKKIHTDDEEMNPVPQRSDDTINGKPSSKNNDQNNKAQSSHGSLIAFVVILVIVLIAALGYIYYRKKKQRGHPTFARTQAPQETVKDEEKKEYREQISLQRKERRNSLKKQREERRSKVEEKRQQRAEEKQAKKDAEQEKKNGEISKRLLDESINSESIEPIDESDTDGSFIADQQVDTIQ